MARRSPNTALHQLNERYRRPIEAYAAGVLDLDDLLEAKERVAAERSILEERLRTATEEERRANLPLDLIRRRVMAAVSAVESGTPDLLSARRAVLAEVMARVTYGRRHRRMRVTLRV